MQLVYWIFLSASFGFIEAIFFHTADYYKLKDFNRKYSDIHVFFTLQRAITYISLFSDIRHVILLAIPCIMIFPFIHDGVYYDMRNNLDENIYKRGFFDEPSITSTARTRLSFKQRTWLAIGGLIIFSFIYTSRFY